VVIEAMARRGVLGAVALMAVAMIVPPVFGWHVHAGPIEPLLSAWRPRVGPGTLPASALGVASVWWGPRLAATLPWPRLLVLSFAAGVAWLASLATVDGWSGIGSVLQTPGEYLGTARHVTDLSATLQEYVDRIPLDSAGNWPTNVAGHPPGALLLFVGLVRIGLGGGLAAGWVVLLLAATTPCAVLLTLRRLGAADEARALAPLLVVGPAAIWMAVSADGMFAAVGAWGLCSVAYGATAASRVGAAAWSVLGGVLLGYCVMLSYGLALLGVPAVGVLVVARSARPLLWAAPGAAAVVLAFAVAGFSWWDALPVLRERYYAGVASVRPAGYWVWGDFAALCFSAGPVVGASVVVAVTRLRTRLAAGRRAVVVLAGAGLLCVVAADLSFMSKAEVERIWLPFVPWLLLGAALLPDDWRRRALAGQVALALAVQTLFWTHW
jgi:hypothetical protein